MDQFGIRDDIRLGIKKIDTHNLQPQLSKNYSNNFNLQTWQPQSLLVTSIHEHNDVVSCLEVLKDNRHFISGSYDGYARIFDLEKIEQDFISDSIGYIKIQGDEDQTNSSNNAQKIKSLRLMEQSETVLIGTEKGIIDLYNIEYSKIKGNKDSFYSNHIRRYNVNGEVKQIESFVQNQEDCFLYVTGKGEIGFQDIRSKRQAYKFDLGRERGYIQSMLLNEKNNTAYIGTLDGYLLVYDIRCNLISNFYCLQSPNQKPVPILSLSNYYSQAPSLADNQQMICISYGSDKHEISVFDLNNSSEQFNPNTYLLSTLEENPVFEIPYLCQKKNESFSNFGNNYSQRSYYENFSKISPTSDILQYLTDPLMKHQNQTKEKWIDQSQNRYSTIKSLFRNKNQATSLICLPNKRNVFSHSKINDNIIISAGNDKNIRFWTISNDFKQETFSKKTVRGTQISNVDKQQRLYNQQKSGDINIIHEYNKKVDFSLNNNQIDDFNEANKKQSEAHKDQIQDMILMERDKSCVLISAGRDSTIKIWK